MFCKSRGFALVSIGFAADVLKENAMTSTMPRAFKSVASTSSATSARNVFKHIAAVGAILAAKQSVAFCNPCSPFLLTPEQIAAHLKEHPAQNDNAPRPPADAEGMKTGSSLSGAGQSGAQD